MSNDPSATGMPSQSTSSGGWGRDDFDRNTKDTLAKRAGFLCSNPQCRRLTSGPHTDPKSTVNIGVAAHITAASSGGPRYDSRMTAVERRQISNGIWLCHNCSKLIDNDIGSFTVDLLNQWKVEAEQHARDLVEQVPSNGWESVLPDELKPLISLELTTPPPITKNIARSADGQFWLVLWDTQNARFRWSKISADYAVKALEPVAEYRNRNNWQELFQQ